jgi:hypothetical protein
MEPVAWQFEDTSDSLIFNAWALLFTTTGDNHWLVPQLSIHIASGLIHEYQHFAFLKEHNMLKRSEEESETFKKEYEKQMETLSSQKEIDFLRKSLNIDFDIKHIPLFRVYEWTNEGSPERMDKYRCSFTDDEYRQDIMCLIQDRKDRLKDVQTDKYEVEATSFNREAFIQTSKLLSLDPKMNGSDKRRITFDF